jgi:hypothetical protein
MPQVNGESTISFQELAKRWHEYKELEKKATEERRYIEDRLLSLLGVSESDQGTKTFGDEIKVKIVCRHNQSVDSDLLNQIAVENDLVEQASQVFRWKAEVNKKVWDECPDQLRSVFAPAITVKPGRPTFSVSF